MTSIPNGNGFDWDYVSGTYFSTEIDKLFQEAETKTLNPKPAERASRNEYYKTYYAENREERLAKVKEWKDANKKQVSKTRRKYYLKTRKGLAENPTSEKINTGNPLD